MPHTDTQNDKTEQRAKSLKLPTTTKGSNKSLMNENFRMSSMFVGLRVSLIYIYTTTQAHTHIHTWPHRNYVTTKQTSSKKLAEGEHTTTTITVIKTA